MLSILINAYACSLGMGSEPGYLWKVDGVPFVWGPIGGLKQFPMRYADGGGLKMKLFNGLKNIINIWQLKHDRRVSSALHKADLLISFIPDSYTAIKKYHNLESNFHLAQQCILHMMSYIKTDKESSCLIFEGERFLIFGLQH